jgi:hypothetical protein
MPAKDVKAYVKRNKNNAADAEAICEAVGRPTMRFVRAKSAEQQGRLMQHRARDLLLRQRTQVINALRAHLAELGIVAAQGREGLKQLLTVIADEKDARLPARLILQRPHDLKALALPQSAPVLLHCTWSALAHKRRAGPSPAGLLTEALRRLPVSARNWQECACGHRQRQISKARQTSIGSVFVLRPRYLAVLSILAWPKSARTVCKSPVPFKMWRAFVRRKDSKL